MGVYGTSAPLDSHDIDADYEDEDVSYIECTICEEEYCEDELSQLETHRSWIENVCENCKDRYEKNLKNFLDEMRCEFDEKFVDGGYV